jgi:tripartite-type tricarboxylate transporter receptor subunit TctC
MNRREVLRTLSLGVPLALVSGGCGEEGPYPDREIRLIVHAAPGGISDAVSRYVARELEEELGVPIITENRTGAAGSVAFSYVKNQNPEGYMLGYAPVDLAIVNHLGYADISPDDFDFLARHTRAPACLAVQQEAPWQSLEEFISHAQNNSRQINMATSGTGSIWHLASLAFARAADVSFSYVPFEGSAPAVTALLGQHVDAVVAGPAEVQNHVEAGNVRVMAVMSDERSGLFPDVPTLVERGYDVQVAAWGGFMAPRGLPEDRKARLTSALSKIIQSEAFAQFCGKRGLQRAFMAEEAFVEFVRSEYGRFGTLVDQMDLEGR